MDARPGDVIRSAVLVRSHEPLEVTELRLPDHLDFGQVLVKIHYSGVCASQLGEINAVKGPDRYLPHLLGHEGSASVLAIGAGVHTVSPGDTVVLHWRPGSGLQAQAPTYDWHGTGVNAGSVTTFSSHAVTSENRMTRIPSDVDLRLAPLLGCAVTTGFGVVTNDAQIRIGESVVVFGAGGVGLAVLKAARLASAYPVVAIDVTEAKLTAARDLGATHTLLAPTVAEVSRLLSDLTGQGSADVVIDTTGRIEVIEDSYELTGPVGRTILVGVPQAGRRAAIATLPLHFGKRLTGSHGGNSVPELDIPRYLRLIDAGLLDLAEFPVTEYALDDINTALDDLRSGSVGRQLIRMG